MPSGTRSKPLVVPQFEGRNSWATALRIATLTNKPHSRPWGIYSGYFRDLDGHLWEILWNPQIQIKD